MEGGVSGPANCLVAIPAAGILPRFLVGPTPNFGVDKIDRTQVNLSFEAELELFDQWRRWSDSIWLKAAPLTTSTAEIPALVPASSTNTAEMEWQNYCELCTQFVAVPKRDVQVPVSEPETIGVFPIEEIEPGTDDVPFDQEDDRSEITLLKPTMIAGLTVLNRLELRVA